MPHPARVNGGSILDLGPLRATQRQRTQLQAQLLHQAGLVCACGERIRDTGVQAFHLTEGLVDSPDGPQMGVTLKAPLVCSRECPHVPGRVIAFRDGSGVVTWVDEEGIDG